MSAGRAAQRKHTRCYALSTRRRTAKFPLATSQSFRLPLTLRVSWLWRLLTLVWLKRAVVFAQLRAFRHYTHRSVRRERHSRCVPNRHNEFSLCLFPPADWSAMHHPSLSSVAFVDFSQAFSLLSSPTFPETRTVSTHLTFNVAVAGAGLSVQVAIRSSS
jgi:hypothetical protein